MSSARAAEFVKQGDDKLSSWFSFGDSKFEDAKELYEKSINLYKMAKEWEKVAQVSLKIAQCCEKLKNTFEASTAYQEAGNAYKKMEPPKADEMVKCFDMAIISMLENGRFAQAGKIEKEIAETFEKNAIKKEDFDKAIEHYKKAIDYLTSDHNSKSSEQNCQLAMASIYGRADIKQFKEAADIYEKVAMNYLENNLLKWSAKECFFKACLLRLAAMENASEQIGDVESYFQRYLALDIHFNNTRESELIEGLINAVKERNIDNFGIAVNRFNDISPLDDWKLDILKEIKEKIEDFT